MLYHTIKKRALLSLLSILSSLLVISAEKFVGFTPADGHFPLAVSGVPCSVVTDENEDEGIRMAVANLKKDITNVTGSAPSGKSSRHCVIIGKYDSPLIQQLIANGQIDGPALAGKNEKYILQTVSNPFDGIDQALVIAGSDKRGTIYGIYELSAQIGVSPWYYWADVPVNQRADIYIKPGTYTEGEPAVRYRGIFLNDEEPALGNWARTTFGGFNARFYEQVFELILRLKGNYIWPAMWGKAFYDDDVENAALAHRMGVVVGTSHHEPMGRAHTEWNRYGEGNWNYQTNRKELQKFWRGGMERMKDYETMVTIGMRGDGDEAMSESTNISLLEKIIKDQRSIISHVTKKNAVHTPQVWALYKEVQDYYDHGMRVPDDVTLLLCDDNWGNVRKLPELTTPPHRGGYGMYYHFDYVGAPRNSKWINISPIERVWEQMNLSYEHGVRELWIVNVGDLKPMEYPIQFFLDMAWNPQAFNAQNLQAHTEAFCRNIFGEDIAAEAARILNIYPKYNRRIIPEHLTYESYSFNYREWERVTAEYDLLATQAKNLKHQVPEAYKNTYYQLIEYPVLASANLYAMYYAQARNQEMAKKKNPEANLWADKVAAHYICDSLLTAHYHQLNNGKWQHMMSQIHIGYTSWNNPKEQKMPHTQRVALPKKEFRFHTYDGYAAMEAQHYTRSSADEETSWQVIPELGRTLSGVTTWPATQVPGKETFLEYEVDFSRSGKTDITLMLSPTLNFNKNEGLRYALSISGGEETIVNFNGHYRGELGKWQAQGIIESTTSHTVHSAGVHKIRIRPLDAGIVIQRIIIDTGGLKKSYLGAPETMVL